MKFDHIAIQVPELKNTLLWYQDFFSCKINWILKEKDFSPLTRSRFPGIEQIVEIENHFLKFHLFNTDNLEINACQHAKLQHICFLVQNKNDLLTYKNRWQTFFNAGTYNFAPNQCYATEIIADKAGNQSFYFTDPNGLEFEASYLV